MKMFKGIYSIFYQQISRRQLLRGTLLVLLLFVLGMLVIYLGGIYGRERAHVYKDIAFMNYVEQDLALNEYARLAKQSKGAAKERYLRLFFDALPRDFITFFKMTTYSIDGKFQEGFQGNTYYSTHDLDSYKYVANPWSSFRWELKEDCSLEEIPRPPISGKFPRYEARSYDSDLMEIFLSLQEIVPAELFYDKMISLGVGGFWTGSDGNCILRDYVGCLPFTNLPLVVQVLERKSDDEIASFMYFTFDGPHPDQKADREAYKELYEELMLLSPRIAGLLKIAYQKVLSEERCPGH